MRTVGVEEELLLVDSQSGLPRSVSGEVLGVAVACGDDTGEDPRGGSLKHELQQEQFEVNTPPASQMSGLETELRNWRDKAIRAADGAGAHVVAAGTSPLEVRPRLMPAARYERMSQRFGITASEHLVCGCHVHVSVESDEEAVGVLDRIRIWLPALLALSSNSPFWQGVDSTYSSFRSQVLTRWPGAGPSDVFGSAESYRQRAAAMIASGVVLDSGMVYFDARLSHRFPTVEIRVADVCLDVRDTVLIAALCRALVDTAGRHWAAGEPPPSVPAAMLRLATWQAGREGIAGSLLDPHALLPRPARGVIEALVDHVGAALRDSGDDAMVTERLREVFERGTGATRQRAVLEKTGQLSEVVADLARVTAGQDPEF